MVYHFNFPETKFVKENSFEKQLKHIASEVEELQNEPHWFRRVAETLDIIHSAETMLRILTNTGMDSETGQEVLTECKAWVIHKNQERGYYNDQT